MPDENETPEDGSEVPSLAEDNQPEESEEEPSDESILPWIIIKEYQNYVHLQHNETGEPRLQCKHCEFNTPGQSKIMVHLNPKTRHYCPELAKTLPKSQQTQVQMRASTAPQAKVKTREVTPEEPFSSESVLGSSDEKHGSEYEDESVLKTPPDPVRILGRILDLYPQLKKPVKDYVLRMCAQAKDTLDGNVIFRHLMAMDGVTEAKARYIVEEFNRVYSAEAREFATAQYAMGYGSPSTSVVGVNPPPGYGTRYDQSEQGYPPMRMRGQFQQPPQMVMTPWGPQMMQAAPFPMMPQRDDRELVDMRRAMEQQSRAFEAGMRSIAEAIKEKPKGDEDNKMMTFLLNQQSILMKELLNRDSGKGESDESKEIKQQLKEMEKKLNDSRIETMKDELSRKIDELEKDGDNASSQEIAKLQDQIAHVGEMVGGSRLSDEAKVSLSEIANASAERRQFYAESRHLLGKYMDLQAAKEGIKLTDEERKRIQEQDGLVDEDEIEEIEKELEEKHKKKKKK